MEAILGLFLLAMFCGESSTTKSRHRKDYGWLLLDTKERDN